ncbi:MAG: nitroreductase family protein [Candidatus Binataceae bacterium]
MAHNPEIGLFEALYSARAMRRFRPDAVSDEILERILDAAVRAPSGGNRQEWRFVVITDAIQRAKIAAIYEKAATTVMAFYAQRPRPAHMSEEQYRRLMDAGVHLHHHMAEAPVLLLLCGQKETLKWPAAADALDKSAVINQIERTRAASIYPAMQNIILACRAFGLGTLPTTNHLLYEKEIRDVLGLPSDVDTYALMPIGYPRGRFGPLSRRPVAEVTFRDHWGMPWGKQPE